jgi:hypothetical protein
LGGFQKTLPFFLVLTCGGFGKDVKVDQATKTWVMEQVNRYQAEYQNQTTAKDESGKSEKN